MFDLFARGGGGLGGEGAEKLAGHHFGRALVQALAHGSDRATDLDGAAVGDKGALAFGLQVNDAFSFHKAGFAFDVHDHAVVGRGLQVFQADGAAVFPFDGAYACADGKVVGVFAHKFEFLSAKQAPGEHRRIGKNFVDAFGGCIDGVRAFDFQRRPRSGLSGPFHGLCQCPVGEDLCQVRPVVAGGVVVLLEVLNAAGGLFRSGLDGCLVGPLSPQSVFHGAGPVGHRRDAGDADANRGAVPIAVERDLCGHPGDGEARGGLVHFDIRAAGTLGGRWHADLGEDLAGLYIGGEHVHKEAARRNRAGSVCAGDVEFGIQGEDCGGPVCGGIGVDQAAADGAPVTDLHVADLCGGFRQKGALAFEAPGAFNGIVRTQRADVDRAVVGDPDTAETADPAEVDDDGRVGKAEFHERNQAVPTGEDFGVIPVLFEEAQGLFERFGGMVVESIGNHGIISRNF